MLKAARDIQRLSEFHAQQKKLRLSNQEIVRKSQSALFRIQRYSSPSLLDHPTTTDIDLTAILDAFHHMQFQAASLNDQFATLTKQETRLRASLEALNTEKMRLGAAASDCHSLQQSLERYFPEGIDRFPSLSSVPTMDRATTKRLRQDEALVCSALICFAESLQKMQIYVQYMGKYVDLDTEVSRFVAAPKQSVAGNALMPPEDKKRRRLAPSKTGVGEEWSGGKTEMGGSARVREGLMEAFGERKAEIEEVMQSVVEVQPVRIVLPTLNTRHLVSTFSGHASSSSKDWVKHMVICLLQEAHSTLQARISKSISTYSQLIQSIQDQHTSIQQLIQDMDLTEQQQHLLAEMDTEAYPGRKVPDKLWELLKATFSLKLRSLLKRQKGALALESDFTSFVKKACETDENSKQPQIHSLPISPVSAYHARESQELALQAEQRHFQRFRRTPVLSRSNSEVTPQALATITALKRSQDVEKALLEQVQGIEKKINRIKLTERELGRRIRLPEVRKRGRLGASLEGR